MGFARRCCINGSPLREWFVVEDGTRLLDVRASFAPQTPIALLSKVLATAFLLFALIYTFIEAEHLQTYFESFSTWSLLFSVGYALTSLINSILGVTQPKRLENVGGKVRVQWVLFNTAMHSNVLSLALFWSCYIIDADDDDNSTHSTDLNVSNLLMNGVTFLVMLLEGFVVNRIPIRWRYWYFTCLPVVMLFLGWTYLHSRSNENVGLYEFFDWNDDDELFNTICNVVGSILVVSPLAQVLLLALSWCARRYIVNEDELLTKSAHERQMVNPTTNGSASDEESGQDATDGAEFR